MNLISLDQSEYKRLDAKAYATEKRRLQIELLKLQEDVIKNNRKICILFEGRDTAGKSSAIKFFSEYLRPNNFNYIQLGIPTKWESSHWFQRWAKVIPKEGEISFLDRSWYTRAITEPIMGYCTENQYRLFMKNVNGWEKKLIDNGVELIKFYFSLSKYERFERNCWILFFLLDVSSFIFINCNTGSNYIYKRSQCSIICLSNKFNSNFNIFSHFFYFCCLASLREIMSSQPNYRHP